ncbi:MAG TPA: amino acid adenylation domain-containing protein, partial [Gemmatimonadales bacterium]|nr:amino acid adenylation domain-containing protein [Gemmatimonadales bacterium]
LRVPPETRLIDWLREVQDVLTRMLQYEYVSLRRIRTWAKDFVSPAMFESILDFTNYPTDGSGDGRGSGSAVRLETAEFGQSTHYPLAVMVDAGRGLLFRALYDEGRFEGTTVERALSHVSRLLSGMAQGLEGRVGELSVLSPGERHQLVHEWNDTSVGVGGGTVVDRFVARSLVQPEAVAVVDGVEHWSYGELDRRSSALGGHLRSLGVSRGCWVGVGVRRGMGMALAVLAVTKAGGAYVPLPSAYPEARARWILSSLGVAHLVTDSEGLERYAAPGAVASLREVVCLDRQEDAEAAGGVRVWGWRARAGEVAGAGPEPGDFAYVIFTSGSTGTPKGVMVRHRPVVNLVEWMNRRFGVGPGDRLLFVTSLGFDLSVYDLFGMLAAGATVRVARAEELRDPERLVERLVGDRITCWDSAPAALQQLAAYFPEAGGEVLRLVLLSGDWVPLALPGQVTASFPRARVVALGGATEATVWSNFHAVERVPEWWTSVPYGRPLGNARYHVLGEGLAPCPVGVAGDLYIGGPCLAWGYAGRPGLTAERFVLDPWGEPGGCLYATGDRARRWADGTLEFLGRLDHQVKVRGFRIELGEVEAVLAEHPAVGQVAVVAREQGAAGKRLVAYVTGRDGDPAPGAGELRRALGERLPEYMVPSAFVALERLPLTANGKVDRQALPEPEGERPQLATPYARTRTPVEDVLAALWQELLGVETVGRHDNFFELGGDSILATRIVARVRTATGADLALGDLFAAPTVAGMAALVATSHGVPEPGLGAIAATDAGEEDGIPLSVGQRGLWLQWRLNPSSGAYNIAGNLRIAGDLPVGALGQALGEIVRRHETLRTRFEMRAGTPVQVVERAGRVRLPVADLTALDSADAFAEAEREAAAESAFRFDLRRSPPVRFRVLRLSERETLLTVSIHHIAADGWSVGVLLAELGSLYRDLAAGRPSLLRPLPVQYAQYARWQRERLAGEAFEGHLAYWRERLDGALATELPPDRRRRPRRGYRGA